jgi:hypothetical protein
MVEPSLAESLKYLNSAGQTFFLGDGVASRLEERRSVRGTR